jgi:O-antigen/teichoic acid export membrane protein
VASPPNLRTRRSALTYASGLAATALSLAISFVATPLLLRWLGDERYGAVRTLSDWFGHLTLLELGLAGALSPVLAKALARGEDAPLRQAMAAGVRAFCRVATLAVAAGGAIALLAPSLVPVSSALTRDLVQAALVALAGQLFYPLLPFRALAEAAQRGYVVHAANFAQMVLATGLALILAHGGYGITGQFAALLAGQLLFAAWVLASGLRRHPDLIHARWRHAKGSAANAELWRLNVPTLLTQLAGRAGLLTDNIVVALILGPAAVPPLFLTQRLIQVACQQIQGVGNASWAALAELHALGRHDVFNARVLDLTRLVSGLTVAAIAPIAAYNHHFVTRWVGAPSFAGDAVTILAAVNAWLLALLSLWGWCFGGTGLIGRLVPVSLISAGLNVAASVVATHAVGLAGPLWGTCIGLATTSLWVVPLELHRTFGTSVGALARAALVPLGVGLLPALGLWFLARTHQPPGWPALGAEMGGAALLLVAAWWRFALRADEREALRERFRAATRRV